MTKEFDPQTESDGEGPFAASTVTVEPRAFSACRCDHRYFETAERFGWIKHPKTL